MAGWYAGSLVTVVLMWAIAWTDGIPSFAGPYIVRYESILDCPESAEDQGRHHVRITHFKPNKPFEMQTATGNFTLTKSINGSMKVSIVTDKRSNNQWKMNYFVLNNTHGYFDMCRYIRLVHGRTDCQIPPRTFSFDQVPLPKKIIHNPILPYGHYRVRTQIAKGNDIAYCNHIELHCIPRPS